MRAIQVSEFGGPEVLELVEMEAPRPRDGEVPILVRRAGVNYADTHSRTDSYLTPGRLPYVPGGEVVGVREDTGERVPALTGVGATRSAPWRGSRSAFRCPARSGTRRRWRCSCRG